VSLDRMAHFVYSPAKGARMAAIAINVQRMTDMLVGLLNTPSPTGYPVEALAYLNTAFARIPGLSITTTSKGALLAILKGKTANSPRAVTAHADTLGLMVKDIKASGRLKLTQLGGFMWQAVEFEGVTIRTFDNQRYRGTVLPSNPSTHVNNKIKDAERNQDLMEVRIDARTTSAADTRALGIEVGDFVFLDPRVEVGPAGFIRSRHLDNKAGVATIYEALMALHEAGVQPAQDTTILITTYEEVGHGASPNLPAVLAELLTVDMGALGDGQNGNEFACSICVKDSTGPYHFEMSNKLRRLAQAHQIAHKVDIYPYYGSDGSAYWFAGGAARVALIGPGVDASHAYERTHQDSLYHTAHLIARYLIDEE
jgi:putative aminopeptidase FrvX